MWKSEVVLCVSVVDSESGGDAGERLCKQWWKCSAKWEWSLSIE